MKDKRNEKLEKRCANRDSPVLSSKCDGCRGYNSACEQYIPLRVYVTRSADYYFRHRIEARSF